MSGRHNEMQRSGHLYEMLCELKNGQKSSKNCKSDVIWKKTELCPIISLMVTMAKIKSILHRLSKCYYLTAKNSLS